MHDDNDNEMLQDLGYDRCDLCNKIVPQESMMEVQLDIKNDWKFICMECYEGLAK